MSNITKTLDKRFFQTPKENDLRIWWNPQVGRVDDQFYMPVATPEEAKRMLDTLAFYDLYQFENRIKGDFANMGGLEVFLDGEWCEWESEEYNTMDNLELNYKTNKLIEIV